MNEDQEIKAMDQINAALSGLEPDAAARILRWACERYNVTYSAFLRKPEGMFKGKDDVVGKYDITEFEGLADFFGAVNPKTNPQKVLVVGCWYQEKLGQKEIDAQQINTELKELGYGIKNITRAFDILRQSEPSLAFQIRKKGTTKQARKKFKITGEGIRTVKQMLGGKSEMEG